VKKERKKQPMKNSVCSFVLMLLCIVLAVVVAIFGVSGIGLKSVLEDDAINKGLDLVGGSSVTFRAIPDEDAEDFNMAEALDTVETILRQRLDSASYHEAVIARVGDDQIRVDIPGIENPEEATAMLGSTAKLEFRDSSGNVIMEGDMVKNAAAQYGETGNGIGQQYYVALELTGEGAKLFADATESMAALKDSGMNYIGIYLDGEPYSQPSVEERIDGGSCVITGQFTQEQAMMLAGVIKSGKLPVELEEIENRFVGPTLGSDALDKSIKAGAIGILLVMVFMILVYRVPGVVSALALVGYVAVFAILLVFFRVNLSLPGIAGIILTIGMAVDANVVIYERIKEELNMGKSSRAAVRAGFKSAFTAIFDSNITTIIASAVLIYYGVGAVKGFAITLLMGVLISLFTALVVTRVLLYSLADMGVCPWLLGAKKKKNTDAEA